MIRTWGAFWLRSVLCATKACNFSSLIWPDDFAPVALASLLLDPPELQNIWKNTVFRDFSTFSRKLRQYRQFDWKSVDLRCRVSSSFTSFNRHCRPYAGLAPGCSYLFQGSQAAKSWIAEQISTLGDGHQFKNRNPYRSDRSIDPR